MHKKCIVEDSTVTLCEIDTSKMYSMHKKCLIVENITVTLYEIDTSKMYSMHKCLIVEDTTYCDILKKERKHTQGFCIKPDYWRGQAPPI